MTDTPDTHARKRNTLRLRVTFAISTVALAATALIASPLAQAIIMKDGNICDPIRHIGC